MIKIAHRNSIQDGDHRHSFQRVRSLSCMTLFYDNMAFGLKASQVWQEADGDKRVQEAAEILGLKAAGS